MGRGRFGAAILLGALVLVACADLGGLQSGPTDAAGDGSVGADAPIDAMDAARDAADAGDAGDATRTSDSTVDAPLDSQADTTPPPDTGVDSMPGDSGGTDASLPEVGPPPDACASMRENCQNNVDDNCDGLVDCADPQCMAGYMCVLVPPPNWSGSPMAIAEAAPGTLPTCTAPYPTLLLDEFEGIQFAAAMCSACSCGPASGVDCSTTYQMFYPDSSCANWCAQANYGICIGILPLLQACGPTVYTTLNNFPSGGSCTPSGGAGTTSSPSWAGELVACAPQSSSAPGGCGIASECVPRPPTGFAPAPCIEAAGDQACPGGYPNKQNLYYDQTSYTDTRSCSACSCATPTGGACTATMAYYKDGACSVLDVMESVPKPCSPVPPSGDGGVEAVEQLSWQQVSPGSCAPQGGQPTGAVTPNNPHTFCCP